MCLFIYENAQKSQYFIGKVGGRGEKDGFFYSSFPF